MIRKATMQDAPALTKMVSDSKETKNIVLTSTYLDKNNVFLAEQADKIVGFCAIHEVKQAIRCKNTVIDTGYWLEQFVISPEATETIAETLIQYIKDYCLSNEIKQLKVFASHEEIDDLYIKMGASRKNNTLLFKIGDEKMSLAEKLATLDEDIYEDALYEAEEARYYVYEDEDEVAHKEMEADVYEDEDDDNENEPIFLNKENLKAFKSVTPILTPNENKITEPLIPQTAEPPYFPSKQNEDKVMSRLSYEECKKSVVPISYTFEKDESKKAPVLNEEPILQEEPKEEHKEEPILQEEPTLLNDDKKEVSYEKILKDEALDLSRVQEVAYDYQDDEKIEIPIENPIPMLYQQVYTKMDNWVNEKTIDTLNENKHFDRHRAKILLRDFNHLEADSPDTAYELLEKLFGKVGEDIHIEPRFKCSYGYNIEIGDNFYADANCIIDDNATVKIGHHCILSPGVSIFTLAYPLDAKKRKDGQEMARPVTIGDNVWIGGNTTIYPGVTIGNNVVVSPGAVVIDDIPDDVIVAGNPAQVIQY